MPSRSCRCLSILTAVVLLTIPGVSDTSALAADKSKSKPKRPPRAVARIDEMVEWLAREQQQGGGFTWKGHVAFSAGKAQFRVAPSSPTVVDTSFVALSILRTAGPNNRTLRDDLLGGAVTFVEREVRKSDPYTLQLAEQRSPLTVRIGPHVDTFFALWLLAELRPPLSGDEAGDPLILKLIGKIEKNANPDGTWGKPDAAQNAPLLGHTIGVRALETAHRKGYKVDPKIVSNASKYALTDAARVHDAARQGKWKPDCGGFKPDWLIQEGVVDFEPINETMYLSAARLCVVDQADRSNAVEEARVRKRLSEPASNQVLENLAASLRTIVTTRKTLAATRGQMLAALGKKRSAAPVIFCAEDYLASLLIVDGMGAAAVEQWFPPTVRELVFIQDVDGGVKVPDHIPCRFGGCPCSRNLNMPPYLCPGQLSFCSKDRVFCTAATLAILVADTPYRQGFLDTKTVK